MEHCERGHEDQGGLEVHPCPDGAARQMWRSGSGNQSCAPALCFRLGLWLSLSSSVISFQVSSHVFNASSDLC